MRMNRELYEYSPPGVHDKILLKQYHLRRGVLAACARRCFSVRVEIEGPRDTVAVVESAKCATWMGVTQGAQLTLLVHCVVTKPGRLLAAGLILEKEKRCHLKPGTWLRPGIAAAQGNAN